MRQDTPDNLQDDTTDPGPRPSDLRLRALVAGLLIIPIDNYWVLMMEKVHSGPYPTTIAIFPNVVFMLALLALINGRLRKWSPRLAFSTAEMLVIYTMVAVAAAFAGHDMMPTLVAQMGYPAYYATPENNWANTFVPALPKWLTVNDINVVKPLFEGDSSLYSTGFWLAWLKPALWWIGFIFVLLFVMMCINTLVRRQWTEHERLTFPIVQLPLAMTEPTGQIWRSKLFWVGFGIAFGLDLLNGLAQYTPFVPGINLGFENHDLAAGLVSKPWSAIGWTPYTFYPFVIGIGYLLPADLSFSCWFFYLFWKLEKVAAAMLGMDAVPDFPHIRHQAFGGFVAIILLLVWSSRGYLRQVWLTIMNRDSGVDDSLEPISYRAAAIGALVGLVLLCAFMVAIGMSPVWALAAFVVYFVLAVGITRIRAELGPPVHDMHFSGPDQMLTSSAGIGRMGDGDFVGLAYFYWFNRAYRAHPMPIQMEGMKMVGSARASQRKLFWAVMAAVLVGATATFWAYLHLGYRLGVDTGWQGGSVYASGTYRNLEYWWSRPPDALKPNWSMNAAMLGGFLFSLFLGAMRYKVLAFPFHPIGYVISGSYQINLVWVPLLVSWLIKVNILRFGGLRLYRSALPLFFGLILGEMIMGSLWSLVGIGFDIPYYNFWGQ